MDREGLPLRESSRHEVKVGMTVWDRRTGRLGVVVGRKTRYGALYVDFYVSWEGGTPEKASTNDLLRSRPGEKRKK